MSSTAATRANAHIVARAHEIIAGWNDQQEQTRLAVENHYAWVEEQVNVHRVRRETLPCHHGTSFWPDRGQVCGSCEAEAEDAAAAADLPEPTEAQIMARAMEQARRELGAPGQLRSAEEGDPWACDYSLPPF